MTRTRGDIWKHTTGRCLFDGGKQYTYDFVGHSAPKPHSRYRTGSETAAAQKNVSFKHELLQNPLLEYI